MDKMDYVSEVLFPFHWLNLLSDLHCKIAYEIQKEAAHYGTYINVCV